MWRRRNQSPERRGRLQSCWWPVALPAGPAPGQDRIYLPLQPGRPVLASVRWSLHWTHPFSEALLLARPVTAKLHFLSRSWSEGPCLGSGFRAQNHTSPPSTGASCKEGKAARFFYLFILISYVSHFPHAPFINVLSRFSMNN